MDIKKSQFDWVSIPAGPAWIGADNHGEGPRQRLLVAGFSICRFAVTNRDFEPFVEQGGYVNPDFWTADAYAWILACQIREPAFWRDARYRQPDQPVTGVSFHEARALARWAGCRLPSEVEWEKAARGTEGLLYPWGDEEPDASRAHFAPDFDPISLSAGPVQDCPTGDSPFGCRQMAGNLFEWCSDFFHADTPVRRTVSLLTELRPSKRHVLKGGAWTTGAGRLRAAARWSAVAELRDNIVGIRLVDDGEGTQFEE